ncbi:MAG: DUF4910 domain-containing protein [Candidatus Bipolaricaulis sp.]|nr:DUF4910 domain-containing protein [Candidatus Bipolaricaulis sp.]MDD5219305.1 DUF4910 domain-containing protein [Candidatus Bipolaricaulis sp.]
MRLEEVLSALAAEVSGARAQDLVAEIARFHRTQASPGYDDALDLVRRRLSARGIPSRVHEYPADGRSKTYEWTAPPGWTVRGGCLVQTAPAEERLTSFEETPTCVVVHSPPGAFEGDLVHVGQGSAGAEYGGTDVEGRVVLASGRAAAVAKQAAVRGAVGVVVYPDDERAAASHDLVVYHSIYPTADEIPRLIPAFSVSRRTADALLRRLSHGPVRVRGRVDAEFTDRPLRVLEASLDGSDPGAGEVLLVAHLCHPRPSANDNASGSAVLIEAAGALRALADRLPLRNGVRFLWVPEFYGTLPWAAAHEPELRRVLHAVNLDMVGQSPERIGEPLRVFRAPNHLPSYVHAVIEPLLAGIVALSLTAPGGSRRPLHWSFDPPTGGSDHLVFAAAPHGIPSFMIGHDDPYWHTSLDGVDKVDPTRLACAGVLACALAALPTVTADDDRLFGWLLTYGAREFARAVALAGSGDPAASPELLDLALSIEEARARSFDNVGCDRRMQELLNRHRAALRELRNHYAGFAGGAARGTDGDRPRRAVDGPLVYAVTDLLNDSELQFFKDKLSANHRALAEGLLALCDGSRTARQIALQLSLDAGRLVPVEDIDEGIALFRRVGYVR